MTRVDGTLTLRAPRPEDAAPLTEAQELPGVRAGTLFVPHGGAAFLTSHLTDPSPTAHSIVACWDDVPVGMGGLWLGTRRRRHAGEIYLFVRDEYWGRGIGLALLAALMDLADNWYGLLRVGLEAAPGNARAIAIYEAAGFVREGVKRGDAITDGQLEDTVMMGRLRPAPLHGGESP